MYDLMFMFLENSLLTSVAAILLLLLTRLLRDKTQPKLRRMCWVVIVLCFLIPLRPVLFTVTVPAESNNSALNTVYLQLQQYRLMQEMVLLEGNTRTVSLYDNTGQHTESAETTTSTAATITVPIQETSTGQTVLSNFKLSLSFNIITIITLVWILGMIISLSFYMASYMRFIHRIKRSGTFVSGSVLNDLLDDVCRESGLKRHVRLAISPIISTPIVAGILRPVIYLPSENMSYQRLRFILIHEAVHIKNGDMWSKLLSLAAMVIHWFNPVVYIINRAMFIESELACDAAVLQLTGDENRMKYGETVFRSAKQSWQHRSILISTFGGSTRSLKRRLLMIIERKRTKRRVAVICSILLILGMLGTGLVGCRSNNSQVTEPPILNDDQNDISVSEPTQSPDVISDDEPYDVGPYDIPWWAPPPISAADLEVDHDQTGELIIYPPPWTIQWLDPAISLYKEIYPNVDVIVEQFGDDLITYGTQISTELMAGKGPDILFPQLMFGVDNVKLADAGAFFDMTEIIESDENFNPDDYIKPILDGGIFRNKQYIMPFNYTTIVFLSVASKTDEIGFDMSKISDPLSFINEIVRTLPKAQESPLFKSMVNGGMWLNLHLSSGVQIVDFEANTILPMEAELEELVKAYKPYQPFDDVLRPGYGWYDELASHLLNGTAIFGQVWGITDFIMLAGQLNSVADIQINVLSDIHGKTHVSTALGAAIRSGSPNTQNAWNFIKLLLSQEYQSSDAILNIPVHKNSILVKIEKMYNQFDEVPVGGFITAKLSADEIEKYIEYITNINQSIIFGSWQANTMFVEHMEYFYTGKLSYEETINGLKNQLQIYISE